MYNTVSGNVTSPPDLFTVLQAVHDSGLVGEEKTALTIALFSLGNEEAPGMMIQAPARGGKDFTLWKTLETIYHADTVYKHPTDESETARYYSAKEANKYDLHYVGDMAAMPTGTEKMLKDWGEGNDSTRKVTDITKDADADDRTIEMVLDVPRAFFVTAATDNRNFNLNDYPELLKRFFTESVDTSKDQTERIIRRKAEEHAGQTRRSIDPIETAQIKDYFGAIPADLFMGNPNNRILKPGAVNIAKQTIEDGRMMPTEFNEARFDFDRLMHFMGNCALYHHANRMVVDTGRGYTLLAAPVDYWYVMQIMGNSMVMSALNLTEEDRAILRFLRGVDFMPARKDIQQGLRALGHNIRDSDVSRSLDSMRESGYIREQSGGGGQPNTYKLSDFASVTDVDASMVYAEVVEAATEEVRNIDGVDDEVADYYVENYCQGSGLIAVDPFSGESLEITEDDADRLAQEVASASDERKAIFDDEPMYAQEQKEADAQKGLDTMTDGGGGTLQ